MGSGDLADAADVVGDTRRGAGDEEDDAGKLWLVGDKISIADIVVADLVSV
jgi:glutathione S-transferase